MHVYEEDHHHALLGIRRAYDGQCQAIVVRVDVGIRVGVVERHCDDFA